MPYKLPPEFDRYDNESKQRAAKSMGNPFLIQHGTEELSQEDAKKVVLAIVDHLADWPIPSAEAFRNAVLGDGLFAINPILDVTKKSEADYFHAVVADVIRSGQMIDFGFIPNDLMKAELIRSRTMYETGQLPQPYEDWIALSSWEGGFCGYFFSRDPNYSNEVFCIEIYGVRIPAGNMGQVKAVDVILIYDIIKVETRGIGDTLVTPAKLVSNLANQDNLKAQELRGANCIDPMVTMLRILSDASVPIIDHPAPIKLNKMRIKQGKFPIPPHTAVHTKDYVSLFHQTKSARRESQGGHHASPVAHSRRAHLRHLASGKVINVRDTKVNWRSAEEIHRLFYRLPSNVTSPETMRGIKALRRRKRKRLRKKRMKDKSSARSSTP